jgi:hypothetical protein
VAATELLTPDALRFVGVLCPSSTLVVGPIGGSEDSGDIYDTGDVLSLVENSPAVNDPTWRCAPVPDDIKIAGSKSLVPSIAKW